MSDRVAENFGGISAEVGALLSPEFLDADRCRQWFLDREYNGVPRCPDCGAVVSDRCLDSFNRLPRFTCSSCGQRPRATKGTILQDSPFTPSDLFMLCALIDLQLDDRKIAAIMRVSRETIITWRDKLAAADK